MEERTTQTTGLESYCGILGGGGGDLIHQRVSFISVLPERIFPSPFGYFFLFFLPEGRVTCVALIYRETEPAARFSFFNDRSR